RHRLRSGPTLRTGRDVARDELAAGEAPVEAAWSALRTLDELDESGASRNCRPGLKHSPMPQVDAIRARRPARFASWMRPGRGRRAFLGRYIGRSRPRTRHR